MPTATLRYGTRSCSERRRQLEPRGRRAAFCAAPLGGLSKVKYVRGASKEDPLATEYCENMTKRTDLSGPCYGECRMHMAEDVSIAHCADCGAVLELLVQDDFDTDQLFMEAATVGLMITWPIATKGDVEVSA